MEEIIRTRRKERERIISWAASWAKGLKSPVTAILIGSYARGDFNVWSDIDVILISERFEGTLPTERLHEIIIPPGFEVIPLTPREAEKLLARREPMMLEAVHKGVLLRDDTGFFERMRRLAKEPVGSGSNR